MNKFSITFLLSSQIWSCSKCFTFMHLHCIQHWVRDSLKYKHEKGILPVWGW